MRSIRWFGAGLLTLGLGAGTLFVAGMGPMLSTNLTGPLCAQALIGEVRVLPLPYDPSTGPLSVAVDLMRPTTNAWVVVGDAAAPAAVIPLQQRAGRAAAIWSGRDTAGALLPAGTYPVLVLAEDGRCSEQRRVTVELRPSVVPFVTVRIGETLRLGAHTLDDDDDAGLVWASSDPSVAIVEDGNVLRAVAPGTVQVAPAADEQGGWAMQPLQVRVER